MMIGGFLVDDCWWLIDDACMMDVVGCRLVVDE